MNSRHAWLVIAVALALAGLPAPAGAQAVGSEFQINTYTGSHQMPFRYGGHLVGADAGGNFVVVWISRDQDGDHYGVFGQRFDSMANALGSEFRVNSWTTGPQRGPSVAMAAGGDFVVAWHSPYQDGAIEGIFSQRYDSSGTTLGDEFRVNAYTPSAQRFPSIASDPSGNFVVVWSSSLQDGSDYGVFGRRFDNGGERLGREFLVNTNTTGFQGFPSIASDASGNFVVVWTSRQDGSMYGIFGQRYDSGGIARGSEFRVNSYTTGRQLYPSIAADAGGGFVVVWNSLGQDGSNYGVFGQRYDDAGTPQGGEFRVNSYTRGSQSSPNVASDADGNFTVVWSSSGQDGSGSGIFGQRYDESGAALGSEFRVNTYTTNYQRRPSISATGIEQFVVAWSSYGQDGSGEGVFGQRFDFGEGANALHVGDLDRRAKNVGASWRAQVTTLAHDEGHGPIAGVLVTLDISGVGVRTCTTTAAGRCEVSVLVSDSVPSLAFSVTNLSKAGFSYEAAANHDPDPDSDGTTIVVNQP